MRDEAEHKADSEAVEIGARRCRDAEGVTPAAELVEYLARRLVEKPEEVRVDEDEEDGDLVLRLRVAPDDLGRVIGRGGRIARALRTLVRASGAQEDRRVLLEIVE